MEGQHDLQADPEPTLRWVHPLHTNLKVFRATDFIAEVLQQLPDRRVHLIRRYGLYSSRSRGTWSRKPHLLRLAPEGWKQDHTAQGAVRIGTLDEQYAEASVSGR